MKKLTFLFALLFLVYTQPTLLFLNTSTNVTLKKDVFKYFQLDLTSKTNSLLLFSVSLFEDEIVEAFLLSITTNNSEIVYPNEQNYTIRCSNRNLLTCILPLNMNITKVFFAVVADDDTEAEIEAGGRELVTVKSNIQYTVNFGNSQSLVITKQGEILPANSEMIMVVRYDFFGAQGRFGFIACVDELPNSLNNTNAAECYSSEAVNVFQQLLRLPQIPSNSTYYILLESQAGVKLQFSIVVRTKGILLYNNSLLNRISEATTYVAQQQPAPTNKSLIFTLYVYDGYAQFQVSYCKGFLNFTFSNINGENGQFAISPLQRKSCFDRIAQWQNETFVVNISYISYSVAFELILTEGDFLLTIVEGESQYGIMLPSEETRLYKLILGSTDIHILFQQIDTGSEVGDSKLIYTLSQCKRVSKCKVKWNSVNKNQQLIYSPTEQNTYYVGVSNPSNNSLQFVIQYKDNLVVKRLSSDKALKQIVELNGYKQYSFDLTSLSQNGSVSIKINPLSGYVLLLTSIKHAPTIEELEDTDIAWDGKSISYTYDGKAQNLYISVLGLTEALYYIQAQVVDGQNVPAQYQLLVENGQNRFRVPYGESVLLKYFSHFIPYTVAFTPVPPCVSFGSTLPLSLDCLTLPPSFTDKSLYLNITNSNHGLLYFSIYVNVGEYVLTNSSLFIACNDSCFEIVKVPLSQQSTVFHSGLGTITSQTGDIAISNGFLTLKCQNYPCLQRLNATLFWSGFMILMLEANQTNQVKHIQFYSKPMTLSSISQTPVHMLYFIWNGESKENFLIYSQGASLIAYCSVVSLDQNKSNILQFSYPTKESFDFVVYGDPLHSTMIVMLPPNISCTDCVLTISLFLNQAVIYSQQFLRTGLAYYSSNAYEFQMNIGQSYSMYSSFHIQVFYAEAAYKDGTPILVSLRPLSNCRPLLYITSEDNPLGKELSYSTATLIFKDQIVSFAVLTESLCEYNVLLTEILPSLTTALVGLQQKVSLVSGAITFFIPPAFTPQSNYKISVYPPQPSLLIYVKKVNKTGYTTTPNQNYFDFKSANNTLLVPSLNNYDSYAYLVSIVPNKTTADVSFLVAAAPFKDAPSIFSPDSILLTHYRQTTVSLTTEQPYAAFDIFSSSSLRIYLTKTSKDAVVNATVNNGFKSVGTILLGGNNSYIQIKSDGMLNEYLIIVTLQSGSSTNVITRYQEIGSDGMQMLYPTRIVYDDLGPNDVDCYRYQTSLLLGAKNIVVDVVLRNISFKGNQSILSYSATIDGPPITSSMQYLTEASTFRITIQFVVAQVYSICLFSNLPSNSMQYGIVVHSQQIPFLPIGATGVKIKMQQDYQKFELVQEKKQRILMQLIACAQLQSSQMQLVGSESYADVLHGSYSQLGDIVRSTHSITATFNPNIGYYYLGVKIFGQIQSANPLDSAYALTAMQIENNDSILANEWKLLSKDILRISFLDGNLQIQLPTLSRKLNFINKTQSGVQYTVYLLHTIGDIPLSSMVRCPHYTSLLQNQGKIDIPAPISFTKVVNSTNKTVILTAANIDLSRPFNVTAKAKVTQGTQFTNYYYHTVHLQTEGSSKTGILFLVLVILGILIACGIAFIFIVRKKRKEKAVNFELNSINYDEKSKQPTQVKNSNVTNNNGAYKDLIEEN